MKKTIFILSILFFGNLFSQEKRIDFSKIFTYQFAKNKDIGPIQQLQLLANKNNEFLLSSDIFQFPTYCYFDDLGMSNVKIELNNRLSGNNYVKTFFRNYDDGRTLEKRVLNAKKLNIKENIAGHSCEVYLLGSENTTDEYDGKKNMKFCIDEKSSFNTVPLLTRLMSLITNSEYNDLKMKGLIVKFAPEKSYEDDYLSLESEKNVQDFVYFDHKKSKIHQKKIADSLLADYKKREEIYQTQTVAIDSTASAAIDAAAYAADSTYVGVPPPPSADFDYGSIDEYESTYKKADSEEPNFAVTNLPDGEIWKSLPKHCRKIEENLPKLDNKEFKKHLHNYVGQMCDMYFTQSDQNSVAIKITLDEIRREVLYINENKEKLKSSDKKKVDQYLENLD